MRDWDETVYGARLAAVYDASAFGAADDTADAVEFIASVAAEAGGHRLLELGSGTGRLLIPLAQRGFDVEGVELAPEMVAQMREKPGGTDIPVLVGDMADFDLADKYDVVYLAYNTLFHLETQERQIECLRTATRHLAQGGLLMCEAYAPYPLTRLPARNVMTFSLEPDEVIVMPTRHDQVAQTIESTVVVIREDGIRLYPNRVRYAWPPELDVMARLSGLRLRARWADWKRTAFGRRSDGHVSVYELN
jgi:SAM-dependent methyltransferase